MQVFTPSSHPPERYYDTVLVLRDAQEQEEKTEGGLYKPQRAVELANQGEVRAAFLADREAFRAAFKREIDSL